MTLRKLGPYRLMAHLSEDAFGTLYRAVRVEGGAFGRHALVRSFDRAWMEAGLAARLGEAVGLSLKVGEQPGLAPHLRVYHGSEAFLSYDLVPGRSLAQAVGACGVQGMPFAMEHILTVLRDLSEALGALHGKGLEGALLDPHLVWLGFDGSVLLLDAPVAPLLQELSARRPALAARLQEAGLPLDSLQRDLVSLARLGFAMLTLDLQPRTPEAMVEAFQAWAAREGREAGGWISLFRRMTGLGEPFRDLLEFQFAAGQLLQAEDHAPSTFSLAFLMQTVFRGELRQEEREMASEREQVWTSSGPVPVLASTASPAKGGRGGVRLLVGAALVLAAAGGYALVHRQNQEATDRLKVEVAAMQRREAELDQKRAELDAAAESEARARRRLEQELKEAEDLARREALRQELEAAKAREAELARLKAQAQAQAALAQAERRAAAEKRTLTPAPAAPVVLPSTPAPLPDQPARALQLPSLPGASTDRVKVRVFVSEQGRALRALVVEAPAGRGLEEAAKEAALRGTYQPAVQGGAPARAWVEVELNGR